MTFTQVRVALLMLALSLMSYFDRTILSVAGPGIIKEFSLSETEMGMVYAAFQLSYAFLMAPGGRWADRYGPRNVLTVMGVGAGVFTALLAFGTRPGLGAILGIVPSLVLLRLCFGIFTAPLYPATGRMNANWIPIEHRTRVQGIVNSGAGFGGAVSPILFSWMILTYGWRPSFVTAGAVTVALAAIWFFTVRDHPAGAIRPKRVEAEPARWRLLLADRTLQLITLSYFAIDYFEYIFFFWLYYYLGEVRKLDHAQTAIYTTIPFVFWVIMMPLGGWVADRAAARFGRSSGLRAVAILTLAASALCLFAGVHATGINLAVGLMSLALGLCAIADVVCWTAVIDISGRHVGAACGIMNTGGNIGGFFAPLVTPMIAGRFGWEAGLYCGGFVALIGLVTWLWVNPEHRIVLPTAAESALDARLGG